jgi:pimeloyl-ACP methyl ester carboxylesterase
MQDLYIEVAGCRVRYHDSESGKLPLLFIHGIGESLEFWMHQEPLAGDTYRIIAIDLPGHGLSASGAQPYDPAKFAAFCWEFLDVIGIKKVGLIGNSMGGGIAILMADTQPSRVEKLLLANAATIGRESPVPFRMMTVPLLGELITRPGKQGVKQQLKAIFYDPGVINETIRSVVTRNVMNPERARDFLTTLRGMTDFGGQRQSVVDAAVSALKRMDRPVLFLHGRHDSVIPCQHSVTAQSWVSNAKLEIFEECGHTPQLEKPDLFNKTMTHFFD